MGSEYLVVKFLMYDNDEFVIVPKSWTWLNSDEDTAVSYPEEIPARTRKRVENNEPCSRDWKMFRVSVLHCADSYKDAREMILNLNTTEMNSSVDATAIDDAYIDEVSSLISNLSIREPDEFNTSDDTKSETTNSKPTTVLQDLNAKEINEMKQNKDEKVTENVHENGVISTTVNTDNDVKEDNGIREDENVKGKKGNKNKIDELDKYKSSKQILRSPYKENKQDAPRSTLRYTNLIELVPGSNVFIDAEELERCKASSNNRDELVLSLMKAIFTNEGLVRCLLTITEECSKDTPSLNKNVLGAIVSYVKEMKHEKWANKPDKKLSSTIKQPYLTKLLPDSNVLVNAKDVLKAVSSANGSRSKLACALMRAVFTKESLRNCFLAEDAKGFNSNDDTMPKLDENGKEAILKFVETVEDDEQNRWNPWNRKSIVNAMYYELEKWRSMWYFQKV